MENKLKIAITGASGLVGAALSAYLKEIGYEVIPFSRKKTSDSRSIFWNIEESIIESDKLENLEAIVHLAGESIAEGRWSKERKRKIRDSRIVGTRLLCNAIAGLKNPPKILISASAIGYYGNRGDEILDETHSAGSGFLAETGIEWEKATKAASDVGVRVVNLRIGVVMSLRGGALLKMLFPFKLGLGGTLSSGKQYVSWITLEDLLEVVIMSLNNQELTGPLNAVAPNPITNKELTRILAKTLKRPAIFPVPAFVLRLIFGEMADEALLSSARVIPGKLIESNFKFKYPNLQEYLEKIC